MQHTYRERALAQDRAISSELLKQKHEISRQDSACISTGSLPRSSDCRERYTDPKHAKQSRTQKSLTESRTKTISTSNTSCPPTSMGKRKKPTDDASQAGPSKRKKGNAALSKQIKSSIPAKTTFTETSKTESAHKRPRLPGKVKRLSTSHPKTTLSRQHGSHEAGVTLSGAKVNSALGTGGFLSGTHGERGEEEIWVTRKTDFAYSLKRSLAAFVKRGCVLREPVASMRDSSLRASTLSVRLSGS